MRIMHSLSILVTLEISNLIANSIVVSGAVCYDLSSSDKTKKTLVLSNTREFNRVLSTS